MAVLVIVISLSRTGNSLESASSAQLFESYLLVIDAAKQGKGITLEFQHLMGSAIERGELVSIGPKITRSQADYYVVAKPGNKKLASIVELLKTDDAMNNYF
jgi:DNA-binding transcriptional LysR family regulator